MARRTPSTNLTRVVVSGLVATAATIAVLLLLVHAVGVELDEAARLVTFYVVAWPLDVAIYATWSLWAYARLDPAALRAVTAADADDERRPVARALGVTGATNTTVAAAVAAVLITVVIARRPEFQTSAPYIVLTLLTVASSWVLMVFSFAQAYLRLDAGAAPGAHLRFSFPEPPRFGDYLTLATTLSASAAAVPAEVVSRAAWRLARVNTTIAFLFNSVIIAMMVSLLFGGLVGS